MLSHVELGAIVHACACARVPTRTHTRDRRVSAHRHGRARTPTTTTGQLVSAMHSSSAQVRNIAAAPARGARGEPWFSVAGAPSPVHILAETLRKPPEFFDFWIRGFRCPLRDMINHISVHKLKLINA